MIRLLCWLALTSACVAPRTAPDAPELQRQVFSTESAFARTMAERDFATFASFLSTDAVFFTEGEPLRGNEAVAEAWEPYFARSEAPFSWEPESVEVLASGDLALSTGPVRDPSGKLVATFTSIWRLEPPGVWRIVFDKGNPVTE